MYRPTLSNRREFKLYQMFYKQLCYCRFEAVSGARETYTYARAYIYEPTERKQKQKKKKRTQRFNGPEQSVL